MVISANSMEKAGDYAEDLAAEMLASTLGVEFDPNKSYDELRETWKISDRIVKTRNITQSAVADKDGKWTTVIAVAVFICDEYKSVKDLKEQICEPKAEKAEAAPMYEEKKEERLFPEIDTQKNGNGKK